MMKSVGYLLRSRMWFKGILVLLMASSVEAAGNRQYTPNDVYTGVVYANAMLDKVLKHQHINRLELPESREVAARPMHVYELHSAILSQLHVYTHKHSILRPPPLAVSTPIEYTPTDVYYLTRLIVDKIEEIHELLVGEVKVKSVKVSGKSPVDVYRELFKLYYRLSRLIGTQNISPDEVYAHMVRAKEDLQYSLLTLSKRLDEPEEERKILLVSAIYGMHPNGSLLSPKEENKKMRDVLEQVFAVREKLNLLRQKNNLPQIDIPDIEVFSDVKPIDAFLQTQFIIAELNLLKLPMQIATTTNLPKPVKEKTASDALYEAKHIEYMLDRLLKFNLIGK
ncbi:hypothetical protein [Alteromonas sp. a30]|uniref:hypothetical protein n=1 Tax=Alteromonas sp. a30 TaxID=2730917 RepID=UPI0022808B24|nr:hypothetical protein [Alteromonas sp. a30]MCY7294626.1 hypothetical protein [Alteromonas sp. a30]